MQSPSGPFSVFHNEIYTYRGPAIIFVCVCVCVCLPQNFRTEEQIVMKICMDFTSLYFSLSLCFPNFLFLNTTIKYEVRLERQQCHLLLTFSAKLSVITDL